MPRNAEVLSPITTLLVEDEYKPEDKCGIVAIRTFEPSKHFPILFLAGQGVQHRGQKGVGIAMSDGKKFDTVRKTGLLTEAFPPRFIRESSKKETKASLLHTRYGTAGGYKKGNLQPFLIEMEGEPVVLIHNGQFLAMDKMRESLSRDLPMDASDTRIFTEMLSKTPGYDFDERLLNTLDKVEGAYNLLIGKGDTIYAARDNNAIHPFVLGVIDVPEMKGYILASETHALERAGAKTLRTVRPGEVLKVDDNGLHHLRKGKYAKADPACIFEHAYFSHPNSTNPPFGEPEAFEKPETWNSVAAFRMEEGRALARRETVEDPTFVVAIPDSGVHIAAGFAQELGIPLLPVLTRDHYSAEGMRRQFQADENMDEIIKNTIKKLLPVPGNHWKDARAMNLDDSIVRSFAAKAVTQMEFELGASEVHWRIGMPPIMHPCDMGISMRTYEELIAHVYGGDEEEIAREIGATSVVFITPQEFMEAWISSGISRPNTSRGANRVNEAGDSGLIIPSDPQDIFRANGACGKCITGRYPYELEKFLELQNSSGPNLLKV